MVDLTDGTKKVVELFVKCLTTLPNLHTLEIVSIWRTEAVDAFQTALRKEKPRFQLQRVRRLILPPAAHRLLGCCPSVEDLTCCSVRPGEYFIGSLVASKLNHLTKLSVMYLGGGDIWLSRTILFLARRLWYGLMRILAGVAKAYPGIRELSAVLVSPNSITLL